MLVNLISPIGRRWRLFLGNAGSLLLKAEFQSVALQLPVSDSPDKRVLVPKCQCFSRCLGNNLISNICCHWILEDQLTGCKALFPKRSALALLTVRFAVQCAKQGSKGEKLHV